MSEPLWVETGAFPSVLLVGAFAVKIARSEQGIACNQHEAARAGESACFCPVLGRFDDGRVLVMERADPLTMIFSGWIGAASVL